MLVSKQWKETGIEENNQKIYFPISFQRCVFYVGFTDYSREDTQTFGYNRDGGGASYIDVRSSKSHAHFILYGIGV